MFEYCDYEEYEEKLKMSIHENVCIDKEALELAHYNAWDSCWDLPRRHKLHWFYLDLTTMTFHPLFKWKYAYKPVEGDRFTNTLPQDRCMSRIFNNIKGRIKCQKKIKQG